MLNVRMEYLVRAIILFIAAGIIFVLGVGFTFAVSEWEHRLTVFGTTLGLSALMILIGWLNYHVYQVEKQRVATTEARIRALEEENRRLKEQQK
jgi:hypothetical protein